MNKRFWIICLVIGSGLLTLSVLGLSSLGMHEKGLRAERQQEFIDVAKKVSFDIKKKVDTFLQAEQSRLYTDYQPYYVPEIGSNPVALVPSPLANLYSNDFANGYFQLESDGQLTSPHFAEQPMQMAQQVKPPANHSDYFDNVRQNLLPSLQNGRTLATHRIEPTERDKKDEYGSDKVALDIDRWTRTQQKEREITPASSEPSEIIEQISDKQETEGLGQTTQQVASVSKDSAQKRSVYPISNLKEEQQATQVLRQRRDNYDLNILGNTAQIAEEPVSQAVQFYNENRAQSGRRGIQQSRLQLPANQQSSFDFSHPAENEVTDDETAVQSERNSEDKVTQQQFQRPQQQPANNKGNNWPMMDEMMMGSEIARQEKEQMPAQQADQPVPQEDTVQIRIEPFVPVTVSDSDGGNGIFAGQVYLLRHVQIEDRHLIQGFQLNEDELLTQIAQSTKERLRRGMGYEISKIERPDAEFAAILQFDFGEVVLNLLELEPGLIQARVLLIRNWFFGILGVVWLAVLIAMAALWKNMNEQIQLARKKDDFISAVSHELRTPLTSIRMYTEMLEKNWVKTDTKRREYYTTMRTESERLTRLIENVLDFSRIQRGKKKYDFSMGDINECIGQVADTMRPYIERAGFVLEQRFEVLDAFAFDRDAVMQIVINLLDNALKYAKDATDKHIIIRTRKQKDYAVIEVEDHGPGIGRNQQKKIFDAFYRCEDESTRQSTGTGLGLALVKRFAEAHHGFVEIANAKPTGALFRVGLAN